MVCIPCFIAPVLIFVWFKFIEPLLRPLVARIWDNYQLPNPFANLTCPMPQKPGTKGVTATTTTDAAKCPVAHNTATTDAATAEPTAPESATVDESSGDHKKEL
ncbi:UPF0729 protein C18orf32 homolog [Oppia nitens]|uniref:UPF0729 protein C18orf32 homolog n=1 Tax=Oppia nitens TaxID=1686743 RepID=UPI0023DC8C36|nr:UPF0729 protein C18orf32 homolog [Oppia nitens]